MTRSLWTAFTVGVFLGANGGVLVAGMLCAASRSGRAMEPEPDEGDELAAHGMGDVRVGPEPEVISGRFTWHDGPAA